MSKFMKLSRAEMKEVMGGLVDPGLPGGPATPGDGGGGTGRCNTNTCEYWESPTKYVSGTCGTNSRNQCICNAISSSVPHTWCTATNNG